MHTDTRSLALFHKISTPNHSTSEAMGRLNRSSSPSPTIKVHRGCTDALPFHCSQKNFLCIKSQPSTSLRSSKSPGKLLTMTDHRTSVTMLTASSPQSMHTMGQPSQGSLSPPWVALVCPVAARRMAMLVLCWTPMSSRQYRYHIGTLACSHTPSHPCTRLLHTPIWARQYF